MRTDDDLRDALRDLAEEWEDDGTVRRLIARRQVTRRRRRFAVAAVSAAAVVLAVVSIVGVLGDRSSEDSVVTDDLDAATPTTITTTTTTSTTTPDPSTLTLDSEQVAVASVVVEQFLLHLRTGDLSSAAQLWSGYPEVASDDVDGRIAYLEELRADPEFAEILAADGYRGFTTPAWGWTTALPVVTVALPGDRDRPLAAVAFLVDAPPTGHDEDDPEDDAREQAARRGARIQRISLPRSPDTDSVPASGSVIEAGQEIVVRRVPVEGGARAFVNGVEVPVEVDHEALTMTLRIPESATGHVVVTLSSATPELPAAEAFAYTVRDG